MQIFWDKKCKIAFFWKKKKKKITNKFSIGIHCTYDLNPDSSRKTIKHFEFYGIWSFYKILKIGIFGKLTGDFENFI